MFGLSFGEILIIAVLALLLLGPERLPDAAKTLGKGLRDLRRATDDIKDQVEREIYSDERKPARPALVPPVPAAPPIPGPAGPPPPASADNVPGLEAALAEPTPASSAEPTPPSPAEDAADGGPWEGAGEPPAPAAPLDEKAKAP
jgi:sec-independent protein translocase protein TatB